MVAPRSTGSDRMMVGRTGLPWPDGRPLLSNFRARARDSPERVAMLASGGRIRYGELARRSREIAIGLRQRCPEPGSRVAVLADDPLVMALALLAVLEAGQVYVPLNPEESPARLTAAIEELDPALVLVGGSLHLDSGVLGSGAAWALRLEDGDGGQPSTASQPAPRLPDDGLAWIMPTSGSTGTPRGVMQTRRNVLRYAWQVVDGLGLGPTDGLLLSSPLHVHAGAILCLAGLLAGAAVHLIDLRRHPPEALAKVLVEEQITVLFSVPTVLRRLRATLHGVDSAATVLRLVRLSGETVTRDDCAACWQLFPSLATVSVGLGTTETGGLCHAYFQRDDPLPDDPVSCGRPVHDVALEIVDDHGTPVTPGEAGRIVAVSRYLSPGYFRQAAVTAAVFEPIPDGRTRFTTGDIGRIRPAGDLEHLGRADSQVKIRGRRVDLAEIESVLRCLPGILEAAAKWFEDAEPPRLVGYLVAAPTPSEAPTITEVEIRAALAARLPLALLPASLVWLSELPQTRNGKLDRAALPLPTAQTGSATAALSAVEAGVCEIWSEVLGTPISRPDIAFLAVGGDSLRATQVAARIADRFGIDLQIGDVFSRDTVAALAQLVETLRLASE